jgi:hypothetical protein
MYEVVYKDANGKTGICCFNVSSEEQAFELARKYGYTPITATKLSSYNFNCSTFGGIVNTMAAPYNWGSGCKMRR